MVMRRPLTEQIQKNRISRSGSGAGSGPRKQAVPQHHDGIFKYRYRGAGYRECRVRRGIRYSTSWPVGYGTLQGCRMSFRAFSQVRVTSNNIGGKMYMADGHPLYVPPTWAVKAHLIMSSSRLRTLPHQKPYQRPLTTHVCHYSKSRSFAFCY